MSGFEFVFALFGLLLGLATAEVLAGFAQTLIPATSGIELGP